MEPGGIEPPSRNSQQAASTCIVVCLILTFRRQATACERSSPRKFNPAPLRRQRRTSLLFVALQSPQASGRRTWLRFRQPDGPARSRSDQRCDRWHLKFCTWFNEANVHLDMPPQAFPVRSIPVGPNCQRTRYFSLWSAYGLSADEEAVASPAGPAQAPQWLSRIGRGAACWRGEQRN